MKKIVSILISFLLLSGTLDASPSPVDNCSDLSSAETVKITNLMVEYAKEPLGIDVENPRFSWQMLSPKEKKGYKQRAYQLVVQDESGRSVWDSGIVQSDISLNIPYAGCSLQACTRYNWTVQVWDQENQQSSNSSWFETGLMNSDPALSAWNGAKWIGDGDDDLVFYPDYLPLFKLNCSIQLGKKSTRAGIIYGANDNRLMDKNKNIYGLNNGKDESCVMVELDVAGDEAMLHIYRVGYHPTDKETPFQSFPISTTLINEINRYEKHILYIYSVYGRTQVYIDATDADHLIASVHLNPAGNSSDYTAFPLLSDIGFYVPEKQEAFFSDLEVRNYRSPSNLLFCDDLSGKKYEGVFSSSVKKSPKSIAIKNGAYRVRGNKAGAFILANARRNSMPMLRTSFETSQERVEKARLYVTARGIYEISLNGQRIGEDYFNPGLTQYTQTHLYQTYDVTEWVRPGKNAIGALLGEGWWSGGATYMDANWNLFGDRQSLLAQLVITYESGKEEVIVTDPNSWFYYNDGPIVYSSFFQGEVYDASKEDSIWAWDTPEYDCSFWKRAKEVSLEGHIGLDMLGGAPKVDDYSHMQLIGQFGENASKIKELVAESVEEVRPGVFVYDMGQNMVGVPKIHLSGMEPGKKLLLRYAEVKYPDLPEYGENVGMIMLENLRGALVQDIYITKGGEEEINPRFTFHGYRFLEITGIESALPVESVKGEVISSIKELNSYYETSNPKVNKLWENITWSTYGNFLSIPTDCPQRNERLGWSGDISVFSKTATYLAHLPQFLRRHMLAMRNTQREDGRFADVAPLGGGFGGILWGSAGITVAWESYQQYDDKVMLAEHYDAMKRYMDYLQSYIHPETGIITEGNLGDWLGPEQNRNDNTLLWEAYYIYDLDLMAKMAAVLGKEEESQHYEALLEKRKVFFNQTYLNDSTKKTVHSGYKQWEGSTAVAGSLIDTQTSYVLPFIFDIYKEEDKALALANLVETITRENIADIGTVCPPYSLMTGFIGTAWINRALSDNGASDVAYRVLQQTTYPSWLYSVEQGATTIWERLNSYTHMNGFGGNNSMNSFNHYSFGAVGSWMYNYSLGIERDEKSPGFKHFVLKPEPDPTGEMRFAKGYYDSMYGRIESSWKIENDICSYRFVVPANTTATLYLPATDIKCISKNGDPVTLSKDVQYIGQSKDLFMFELLSGEYTFDVKQ